MAQEGKLMEEQIIAKEVKLELVISKEQEQEQMDDKRWNVQSELANVFEAVLKLSYPQFEDETCCVLPCVEKFGDYSCENVLSIWPKLRGKGTTHRGGPTTVGLKLKTNLEMMRPKMLEPEPLVHDVGFVSIKLSGKWMAKSVHKMLKDGIDTWAPEFLMESVLVNFPSYDNTADLMPIDFLRRDLITTTLFNMLQYSNIPVEFSMPPKESPIEERDDGVLIYRNTEGEREIHVTRDKCCGDPVKDLTDLWYGLKEQNADWIICVSPVQQQEYVKTCITAAKRANWLPRDWRDSPRASFTGFQTYNNELKHENLDSLLNEAKTSCIEAAKVLGYTGEQVSNCALKYTILKNDRLADYSFDSQEMLNLEGNTFVYLLNTLARIHTFTKKSREGIDKLKKDSELTLGKDEIWKEGVERALVLHLLAFTNVVEDSCLPVLPHILCEYLYGLSKNFNRFCDKSSICEETELLLCEATRVVMQKGFELLGITREASSLGEDWPQQSSSLLKIERLNFINDPPKINTRFELFSFIPNVTRDTRFKTGKMFGQIIISDTYNLLSDGWGPTNVPDHGFVSLFDRDWPDSVNITNRSAVDVGNPGSRNLVPFSSLMEVRVELYASTVENDALFELSDCLFEIDCEEFLNDEDDARCCVASSEGSDGLVRMYYVLLKDAIDSKITVTYLPNKDAGGKFFAEIFAHYGSDFFDENTDPVEKDYYTATLFRSNFGREIREIPLERSRLAVPSKGSIVIVARLWDVECGDMILDDCFTFTARPEDSNEEKMDASGTLRVSVDWSRG